jgi:5,10-methenyltetrahydrofolate synthetase
MTSVESSQDSKDVLRRKFRAIRKQYRQAAGFVGGEQLRANLTRLLADYAAAQICLYRAQGDEADCTLKPVSDYYYPCVFGDSLRFVKPRTEGSFVAGAFSIEEPDVDWESPASESMTLDVQRAVVVCCPALAVDAQGVRLGQGKGYYDRFFAQVTTALRVGVVFQSQVSASPLPAESWDQALDWIVTDKMILRTRPSQRSS